MHARSRTLREDCRAEAETKRCVNVAVDGVPKLRKGGAAKIAAEATSSTADPAATSCVRTAEVT